MFQQGLTTRATLRRFTLGSGPLKRTSDRLQHLARILLVLILLIGVAVALAVATAHHTSAQAEAAAQAADRHRAKAQVVKIDRVSDNDTGSGAGAIRATAVWTDSSGADHRGVIPALPGFRAGSTTTIWIDQAGNRTTRPRSNGDVAAESFGYALLTYIGISVGGFGAYWSFRKLLDRGRSRRWTAEWADVEPVWTHTVP